MVRSDIVSVNPIGLDRVCFNPIVSGSFLTGSDRIRPVFGRNFWVRPDSVSDIQPTFCRCPSDHPAYFCSGHFILFSSFFVFLAFFFVSRRRPVLYGADLVGCYHRFHCCCFDSRNSAVE